MNSSSRKRDGYYFILSWLIYGDWHSISLFFGVVLSLIILRDLALGGRSFSVIALFYTQDFVLSTKLPSFLSNWLSMSPSFNGVIGSVSFLYQSIFLYGDDVDFSSSYCQRDYFDVLSHCFESTSSSSSTTVFIERKTSYGFNSLGPS